MTCGIFEGARIGMPPIINEVIIKLLLQQQTDFAIKCNIQIISIIHRSMIIIQNFLRASQFLSAH